MARKQPRVSSNAKESGAVLFGKLEEKSLEKTVYDPLPSVWYRDDAELLEEMLCFYPRKPPIDILDATVNAGRFWNGSHRSVVGMDIDRKHKPDILADNRNMPCENESFDVVVYDPPHIPNQGRDKSKDFNERFGLVLKSSVKNGYNFSHLYPPFVSEAYRVLRPEGILFAKIADYVHGHRFQWAHIEFIKAAVSIGFTACDCIVKVRKGPIKDPRWKRAHHARREHCYWLVFRKSKKCE
jgi:SAM-dependent methyltransferase